MSEGRAVTSGGWRWGRRAGAILGVTLVGGSGVVAQDVIPPKDVIPPPKLIGGSGGIVAVDPGIRPGTGGLGGLIAGASPGEGKMWRNGRVPFFSHTFSVPEGL